MPAIYLSGWSDWVLIATSIPSPFPEMTPVMREIARILRIDARPRRLCAAAKTQQEIADALQPDHHLHAASSSRACVSVTWVMAEVTPASISISRLSSSLSRSRSVLRRGDEPVAMPAAAVPAASFATRQASMVRVTKCEYDGSGVLIVAVLMRAHLSARASPVAMQGLAVDLNGWPTTKNRLFFRRFG